MTDSPGFWTAEIREIVHEYQLQPHGQKRLWLDARGISHYALQRWC